MTQTHHVTIIVPTEGRTVRHNTVHNHDLKKYIYMRGGCFIVHVALQFYQHSANTELCCSFFFDKGEEDVGEDDVTGVSVTL